MTPPPSLCRSDPADESRFAPVSRRYPRVALDGILIIDAGYWPIVKYIVFVIDMLYRAGKLIFP